jgi:hypothetical protein
VIARLRSHRLRTNVLPFVLAALALRAFIPMGFMPSTAGGSSITLSMCSSTAGAREAFRLPDNPSAPMAMDHCDFCGGPAVAGPPVVPRVAAPPQIAALQASSLSLVSFVATVERAQSARAPPICG